jgi:hypothetical protein
LVLDRLQFLLANLMVEHGLVAVAVIEHDAVLARVDDIAIHVDFSGILVVIHHDHAATAVLRPIVT